MSLLLNALAGDPEIEALLADDALLGVMLQFEAALAAAEADAGLITPVAAAAIAAGIGSFAPDWDDLRLGMARDGVAVPALVRQLRAAVGEPHAADLHRGATSQDVIDTALMLQLAKIIPILLGRIVDLENAFRVLAERHGSQTLMAHTRMQAALPFTVADKLRTWSEPLQRHRSALTAMSADFLVIQLGGPVGDRASFEGKGEAVAKGLAQRLGLGLAAPWHAMRDPIVTFGTRLAALSGSLGKFGADVALLAQSEVAAIQLTEAGGSSAMPHKSNPVAAEVLVALARHSAGLSATLLHAVVHENERSGAAWTLEWLTLPPLLVSTGASLATANRLAAGLLFR